MLDWSVNTKFGVGRGFCGGCIFDTCWLPISISSDDIDIYPQIRSGLILALGLYKNDY